MDTLSDPLVDRLLDGRYAVLSRIARGGMASVYLATDTRLDRPVAVKVMHPALADDPDYLARFHREARASARLSHPDIVAVYDQGEDAGHPFLVMEYVPGATLRDILRARTRLEVGESVGVMDHVLAALAVAHNAGIVHRDIKPENVLVTADGRVKVADFGLARSVSGHQLTLGDGALLGTAAYLAPEQVTGAGADARTDVYAAGIVFFELLTGVAPFTGDTPLIVANRHVNEDVPPPSSLVDGVPRALDDLVAAATAREPRDRPSDAGVLHRQLASVRDEVRGPISVPAIPATTAVMPASDTLVVQQHGESEPVQRRVRRRIRRGLIALLAVLLLAVGAGVAGWYVATGRYTTTPSLLDLTRTAAAQELAHKGLHAHWLPSVYSDTVATGLVATQQPSPGQRVRSGGTVSLALSLGPDHVPDVRRMTVDQAKALLSQAQLRFGGTRDAYSTSVASGRVIGTDPAIGVAITPGTPVTLVVSKGPAPIVLPDVTHQPIAKARARLQALGLTVTTTSAFNDTVPSGQVVSSNPSPGTTVHAGDTVTLVVSKGPQKFPVPDVTGKKIQDAIRIINQAGFKAAPNQIFPGGPGKVVRETPNGMQPKGTTIELDYY